MSYKQQADIFKRTFDLKYAPIAISFTNHEASGDIYGKISICKAIKLASQGENFIIDEDTSACPGGSTYCGFSGIHAGAKKRRLQEFLTEGEKLTSSIVSFERMQKLGVPPATDLAEKIVITPLEKAVLRPDMVLFLVNAEQVCRLITLDTYWDGLSPEQQIIGALCYQAIVYTIMSGKTNICVGDWTARRHQGFEKDVIFMSVPYERIHNLIAAIPYCSAGDAEAVIPEEFRSD
ncbi:MAG TPA: DUF169 domain-containing protein [Methanobacterium sp.]|nr:MAG: hypothetical protein FGO69_06840 [Methanobacterium sp.]HOI70911.1 DUF169 domain-containing protein [Methanobacterium sp.]